jgi:hypothetical protein
VAVEPKTKADNEKMGNALIRLGAEVREWSLDHQQFSALAKTSQCQC